MDKSESIKELALALSKAQAAMKGAVKDSTNPFFKSNYADLESVWEACRKPLTDNGLSVIQMPNIVDGKVSIETMLAHSSGEWVSSSISAQPAKTDPQSIGSVISYLRRYSLAAVAGVYQTDDDAEQAQGRTPQEKPQPLKEKHEEHGIMATGPQINAIQAILSKLKVSDEMARHERVSKILGLAYVVGSFKDLTKDQASEVIKNLGQEAA